MFVEIPNCISVRGDRLIFRKAFEEINLQRSKSEKQEKNEINLLDNSPSGHVNRKIRLVMKKIISNWVEAVNVYNSHNLSSPKRLFTFVTLTLPSEQLHTDKELYKLALNPFVKELIRKYNVKHYLWRAERQKNGNLHYHLIVDSYIYWKVLRNSWNRLLQPLGYIEEYAKNQKEFHKQGFKVRVEKLSTWSAENQYKAYQQGVLEDWQNPNSTDIHSLKNVKNVEEYVAKYSTKDDLIDSLVKLNEGYVLGKAEEREYHYMKDRLMAEIEATKINGRVWGCSDELRKLKDFKYLESSEAYLLLDYVQKSDKTKKVEAEDYSIYYNKDLRNIVKKFPSINKAYIEHHVNNYNYLYNNVVLEIPELDKEFKEWLSKSRIELPNKLSVELLCLFD